MGKFKAKTEAQWIDLKSKARDYSILLFDCDDFAANAIDLGALLKGDGDNPLIPGFKACHACNLLEGTQLFEADGKKLTYHDISEYHDRYISGDARMAFFSPKPALWNGTADVPLVNQMIKAYLNQNYNTWELAWFGLQDLLNLFPQVAAVTNLFGNPAFNRGNSVVCDQLAVIIYKLIDPLYEAVINALPGKDISKAQPQDVLLAVTSGFDFYLDSEAI